MPGARRARVAHARHAAPHVGDDVDDRAARLARAVVQHPLVDALARDQEAAGQVVADDRVPALGADRRERRGELAAGVVDERVDAAVAREYGGDRRLHRASSRMSQTCVEHAPPALSISARTASSLAAVRPTIATAAPSDASSCAVQRPIPEPPPVTTATWPRSRPGAKIDRYGLIGTGRGLRKFNQALAWVVGSVPSRIIACQCGRAALPPALQHPRSRHAARHDLRRRPHAARQGQEGRQPARGQADRPARRAARQAAEAPRLRPGARSTTSCMGVRLAGRRAGLGASPRRRRSKAGWDVKRRRRAGQPLLRLRARGGEPRGAEGARAAGKTWSSPAASRACRACRSAPTAARGRRTRRPTSRPASCRRASAPT